MAEFSVSTSNNRFTLKLVVTETSTSTTENRSLVSWSLSLKANTSYYYSQISTGFSVSLDGVVVAQRLRSERVQTSLPAYSTITIASGSGVSIPHNDDGSKLLTVGFSIDQPAHDYTAGTLSSTGTMQLTALPRLTDLDVTNGTLGVDQTINITKQLQSYLTQIRYVCGDASGVILQRTQSSGVTSVSWTPAIDLASQNGYGTDVPIDVICETYQGTTLIGSRVYSLSYAIPAYIKPSVVLAVTDTTGYYAHYGAYVQGKSRLLLNATPTIAYGSPIASFRIDIDGRQYSTQSAETDVVVGSGTLTATCYVIDSRGRRSDTFTTQITVFPYTSPVVRASVFRCDASGVATEEGAYVSIGYTAQIASLGGYNTVTAYKFQVRESGTESYTDLYSGSGRTADTRIFACDAEKAFDYLVTIQDDFSTISLGYSVPVAFTLMDFHETGRGITIGRPATEDGLVVHMPVVFEDEFTGTGSIDDTQEATDRTWSSSKIKAEIGGGGSQIIKKLQRGKQQVSLSGKTNVDLDVTFPEPFTDASKVYVVLQANSSTTSINNVVVCLVVSKNATGFKARIWRSINTTSGNPEPAIEWFAFEVV